MNPTIHPHEPNRPTSTPSHRTTPVSQASLPPLPHHPPRISPASSPSPPTCAACKYQRRKCSPNCILAPFFPADKPQIFLNTHRLFGLSKIIKILNSLEANARPEAIRSIIFQSNARAQDPAGGCYRIVLQLQDSIQLYRARLDHVLRRISAIRERAQILQAETSGSCDQDLEQCLNSGAIARQPGEVYNGGSEVRGVPIQGDVKLRI
ncbi:LOB domain-containing protein 22-like [Phalaenopsis equestris]|uniref:LOB domain-containing protein 22-like n=1 Tax=Phalaenopsis equestris TaxID=78828 RepID=UPI0009E4BE00|nr:LOB domain-containing protein 22-like [Phalaenopsis equestris]